MSVITPAASVLLSRGPGSREVFAILRGQHLRFFGGFWAFPGGKLTELEAGSADNVDATRLAACRELFEETGVLIARQADGSFPRIDDALNRCRAQLLQEDLPFERMLGEHGLTVRGADFSWIGQITTPAFAPVRYATTFFVAHVPANQQPSVWPGELERGEWIDAAGLITRWQSGADLLTPPSVMTLQTLEDHPIDEAPRLLGPRFEHLIRAMHPIFFAPCVQMIPLKTVALPPSTHTNAYLVGSGPRWLIDPGPRGPDEQQCLFELLDELKQAGKGPTAIVLTHHHPDHVDAASVCAERYRLPIWAHPLTAERLQDRMRVDRYLHEGDRVDLGSCPANGQPWFLEVLHTPGHASGHLAFFEPFYRLLFAGDMISTVTSMVIAPPDGNLTEYLASLRRLRALPTRLLLPAHGNVSARPTQTIDDALEHRAKREQQLLDTLAEGIAAIDDLTTRLYHGTPDTLRRFARAQVLAGLLKLQGEGRARSVEPDGWQLV